MSNFHPVMTREELEAALEQAHPAVYRILRGRYQDAYLADEMAVNALLSAFEKWQEDPAYFLHHDLTIWAVRLAGWRALDQLRRRTRHLPLPDENHDDDRPYAAAVARFDPDADERLEQRQLTLDALDRLDEIDRRVLFEHYFNHRTDQEVGVELFGDSANRTALGLRVWRIRQRAQARLRDLLMEGGLDAGGLAL